MSFADILILYCRVKYLKIFRKLLCVRKDKGGGGWGIADNGQFVDKEEGVNFFAILCGCL